MARRAGARPVAVSAAFTSVINEGAQEEASYWSAGGQEDAVIFDSIGDVNIDMIRFGKMVAYFTQRTKETML